MSFLFYEFTTVYSGVFLIIMCNQIRTCSTRSIDTFVARILVERVIQTSSFLFCMSFVHTKMCVIKRFNQHMSFSTHIELYVILIVFQEIFTINVTEISWELF